MSNKISDPRFMDFKWSGLSHRPDGKSLNFRTSKIRPTVIETGLENRNRWKWILAFATPVIPAIAWIAWKIFSPSDSTIDITKEVSQPVSSAVNSDESLLFRFYQGIGKDNKNRFIRDMWNLSDDDKEAHHDFIQWLFPLKEQSVFNRSAPTLDDQLIAKFKNDPKIAQNLKISFQSMMKFYGFSYQDGVGLQRASNYNQRISQWCRPGDHNFLRITRILKCLMLQDLKQEAKAFFTELTLLKNTNNSPISDGTYKYWQEAMKEVYPSKFKSWSRELQSP